MRHGRDILVAVCLGCFSGAAGALWGAPNPPAAAAVQAGGSAPATARASTPVAGTRLWFGVAVENIPPAIARQLKLKPSQGLMVSAILPNSPAEKAGLKVEDLLIEINGRPLTSQENLFVAANSAKGKSGAAKTSTLTFLREGDRSTVEITPEERPTNMIVYETPNRPQGIPVRNIVAPNGGAAQVGMGYVVNLDRSPSDVTMSSIKSIMLQGKTIVLSQDTDMSGAVRNTISVGSSVYTVDPAHPELLPAELRPLAEQLIAGTPAGSQPATTRATTLVPAVVSKDQQIKELREQVEALQREKAEYRKVHAGEKPLK